MAIVLLAVVLDGLSRAWAEKKRDYSANLPFHKRFRYPILMVVMVAAAYVLAQYFPILHKVPRGLTITYDKTWDGLVDWIVLNWSTGLEAFRHVLISNVLAPLRDALLYMPYPSVLLLVAGLGLVLGGYYSALLTLAFLVFVGLAGWWDRAMITAYMVIFATFICIAVGIPVGIWSALDERRAKTALFWCDTFQTFPSFIYILPVIMLFQVNDLSAIMAVIVYAIIPAVRYTVEGIRAIAPELEEAATMAGCSTWQRLVHLQLPVAVPHIMLGVNQTIMFAFSMVIIAAFVGTIDLGQQIFKALSETNIGKGVVLGLCVSFMALAGRPPGHPLGPRTQAAARTGLTMTALAPFVPLAAFVLAILCVLLVTAPDRRAQLVQLRVATGNVANLRHGPREALAGLFTIKRVVYLVVLFCLVTYIWTYQSIKQEVRVLLQENEIEGVRVGSLVMPYSAFFRSEYMADTGFSKSRKRTRADISVSGRLWSGFDLHISEIELAKVNKIVGKAFVFSYLTDVKILRPAINKHMKRLVRNKLIDEFKIETFDNRGPYVLVVLGEKNRGKAVKAVATQIAESLHTNLTKTNNLKVNQVVIKVVDPEQYTKEQAGEGDRTGHGRAVLKPPSIDIMLATPVASATTSTEGTCMGPLMSGKGGHRSFRSHRPGTGSSMDSVRERYPST